MPKTKTTKTKKETPLTNIHGEKIGEIEAALPEAVVDEPIIPEEEETEDEEDDGLELAWEE